MVEGAHVRTGLDDPTEHRVDVFQHIVRSDANNSKAVASKQRVTSSISARLIAVAMSIAIDFNDQPPLQTGEVNGHLRDRKLSPELQSVRSPAENLPPHHFGQAHLASQLPCALYLLNRSAEDAWAPSTAQLR
jgi:hypothetical protein